MAGERNIVRVGSAAIIENSEGKFLIGKRKTFPKDMWVFPGGGMNFGETSKQAAIREVKEETGLQIELNELIKVEELLVPETKIHRVIFFYRAKIIGGSESPSSDLIELRWLLPEEIAKLPDLGHTVLPIMKAAKMI